MRTALLLTLLCATFPDAPEPRAPWGDRPRLAGLSDTVPGLFVKLVNDKLKGRIEPRSIRYKAPSSVVLEDAVLLDPHGEPVARVTRGEATLSLSALLLGDIVISTIVLDEPKLLLALHDHGGKDGRTLNLLEALTPKKPPDSSEPSSGAFRVDSIVARRGGFRFADGENVTITADNIAASASVDVDLLRNTVLVDVRNVTIASGAVKLPELDVPVASLSAASVRVLTDRLDVRGVAARVAGAQVEAWGSLGLKPPGDLGFSGTIKAGANAWPDRLKRLPFDTPPLTASVKVTGPYEDPLVRIEGELSRTEVYGYAVDGATARVDVNKREVRILDGSVVRAAGGTARVTGAVALPSLAGDLVVRASAIPMQTALAPAALDPRPRGTLDGRARIHGVFDGEAPILIEANATARRLEIAGVKAPGEVSADARVRVAGTQVTLEKTDVRGPGTVASVRGTVDTDARRLALDVSVASDGPGSWIDELPAELKVGRGTFDGSVRGPFDGVQVIGAVSVADGDAWGAPLRDVRGAIDVTAARLEVRGLRGRAAGGVVTALTPFSLALRDPRRMSGTFTIEGGDLSRLHQDDGTALPLGGRVDAHVVVGGTTAAPRVQVRAAAGGARVADEELGAIVARGVIDRDGLSLDLLDVDGPLVTARAQWFSLRFDGLVVDARARIERLNVEALHAGRSAGLAGRASGAVTVTGDARAPTVVALLDAVKLRAGTQRFGSGPVRLGLLPDTSAPGGQAREPDARRVATVSAHLASDAGLYDVAASYALEREVLHLRAAVSDVDLAPYAARLGESVAPLQGFASGVVEAKGPLDALTGRVTVRVPELTVALPEDAAAGPGDGALRARASTLPPLRSLGEVVVDARLVESELTARVCAFPGGTARGTAGGAPAPDAPCSSGERVWASISGALDLMNAGFDLAVDAEVADDALHDLIPALATRGFRAGLRSHVAAQVTREPTRDGKAPAPVVVAAELSVASAYVVPSGAPRMDLRDPARLTVVDERLTFETPARFVTATGDADLVLSGSAGKDDIDAAVEGKAALALLKLISKEVANASSTADLRLKVRGRYEDGIALEGNVIPTPGAVITPRSLGEPVTFLGGGLSVAPAGPRLFRVRADSLRARIGDGDVQLRGDVDVRTAREDDESWVARYDLTATGGGVSLRRGNLRAEGNFDLVLEGDERAPRLRGRIEVSDGSFKKAFELRNFVLAAAPEPQSDPLWQIVEPYGLANLDLDVKLSLSNFRVLAKITTFSADMSLRGTLALRRTLRFPQLDGAVEVEEGTVDFPRARFDVTEMQLEFPPNPEGRLSPLVHVAARAEIPPGAAGGNDTEMPVDLTLDGSLEEGLRLDLTAIDPAREWSRSDLLGLILFGKSLDDTVSQGDTNIAVRALLREATAPLTAEIEEALLSNFGVAVELDATGWRWQLGRRLELEGAGFLVDGGNQDSGSTTTVSGAGSGATGTSSSSQTSSYATDALRLRFLVLDHLPIGSNLSFESRTGLGGTEVRLSLRLFED